MLAHDLNLRVDDDHIVLDACDDLMLERPSLEIPSSRPKSRSKRATKSRR